MTIDQQKIYGYALKILSGRDMPKNLVEEKIQKKFPNSISNDVSEIIEKLVQEKYIDDIRYIENFVHWRKETMPRGKRMIMQELTQKKISFEQAQAECERLISYQDEKEMCQRLSVNKWKSLVTIEDEYRKKDKLFRFLAGKMFAFQIINEVYSELTDQTETETYKSI